MRPRQLWPRFGTNLLVLSSTIHRTVPARPGYQILVNVSVRPPEVRRHGFKDY